MKPVLRHQPRLRAELDSFLAAKQAEQNGGDPWQKDFLQRLRRFAGGGKLLRGSLVCFTYQVWNGRRPTKAVIRAALAVELAHSGLLIHDDIMDGDELRRGQPSMHRQYELLANRRQLAMPGGFGLSMALSGGDIALLLAFELLDDAGPDTRQLFTKQLLQTCGGQMQDIYLGAAAAEPAKRAIYAVMEQKTASYTVALPLTMGAALAGADKATIEKLRSLGKAAGTIFQIRDDELGALGQQAQTGKPVGADIRENKKTLLRYYLMKRCTAGERQKLAAVFGNPAASRADIRRVQALLQKYEIPELIAAEVEAIRRQAYGHIERLPAGQSAKQTLRALVDFCSARQW